MIYSSKNISLERMSVEIIELKDRILDYQERCHSLNSSLKKSKKTIEKMKLDYQEHRQKKGGMFLSGLTTGELTPCDGYISKLQNRAGAALIQFSDDLCMLPLL